MQQASRTATAAAALIVFEVGAIAVLHALGNVPWLQVPWHGLAKWLEQTPAEESLPALLRTVTLVLAYWLAISTTMYVLAQLSHLPAAVHATRRATLPAIRRLVDRTAALSIVAATVAGPSVPALADGGSQPVVIEISDDGLPLPPQGEDQEPLPPHLQPEGVARIGWTPTPAELPPIAAPDDAGNARGDATEATTWPVEAGDNLWTIAARHLAAATGSGAPEPDLADYWQRVVVANERVIRSGDPDLIYPGETIVLPPVTEVLP